MEVGATCPRKSAAHRATPYTVGPSAKVASRSGGHFAQKRTRAIGHDHCLSPGTMALPFSLADRSRKLPDAVPLPTDAVLGGASHDPRALRILAKSIYRELRQSGLREEDLMCVAGELLSLVAGEVKDRRRAANGVDAPR
jgi:hypothetical protein